MRESRGFEIKGEPVVDGVGSFAEIPFCKLLGEGSDEESDCWPTAAVFAAKLVPTTLAEPPLPPLDT